jgi:hypothetical protein
MGGIDLDPASCPAANETVRATHFYTIRDDGLTQPWFGRIWLNPPYGKRSPCAKDFVRRFAEMFADGAVEQGCILLKTEHLSTKWFNTSGIVRYIVWAAAGRLKIQRQAGRSPRQHCRRDRRRSRALRRCIFAARGADHAGRIGAPTRAPAVAGPSDRPGGRRAPRAAKTARGGRPAHMV